MLLIPLKGICHCLLVKPHDVLNKIFEFVETFWGAEGIDSDKCSDKARIFMTGST